MALITFKSKKASITLTFLIISFLAISSGIIIHQIDNQHNQHKNILTTYSSNSFSTQENNLEDNKSSGFSNIAIKSNSEGFSSNSFKEINRNYNFNRKRNSYSGKRDSSQIQNKIENLNLNSSNSSSTENLDNFNLSASNSSSTENTTLNNYKDVTDEVRSEEELANMSSTSKALALCHNCDNRNLEVGDRVAYCDCDEWEKCKDYFKKSTVYNYDRSPMQSATDYCSGNQILREMYINCLWTDTIYYKEKDCNDFNKLYDYESYCSGDNIRKHQKESDYDCGNGACFFDNYYYINDKFVKNCNDENYKGDWVYYCTPTQVLKHKKYYNYGCSGGNCAIESISWVDETLVSAKGDSGYCGDRKSHGCSLCDHNDYDCNYNSECSGSLECMGSFICLGWECGCCKSDEEWNKDKNICEGRCECSSGPCCDGCHYKTSSTVCNSHISGTDQYKCDGNCLDQDILTRYQKQYCSGTSSSCTGTKEWVQYNYKNCVSSQYCSGLTSWDTNSRTCVNAQCTSGPCCDTTCGVFSHKTSGTQPTGYTDDTNGLCSGSSNSEISCSNTPTTTCYVLTKNYYCNGNDADAHVSYTLKDTCGTCEYCTNNDLTCNYYSSSTKCSSLQDCDFKNYYHETGTQSATSTSYCKYADYDDNYRYCNGAGSCSSLACPLGSDTTTATAGTCKYISGCSGSTPGTVENYEEGTSCGTSKECDGSGNCLTVSITCSSNSDCGTDGWVSSAFCSNSDVYQAYRTWICNNPGTTSSSCDYSDSNKLKQDCGEDYCENFGNNYCKNNDVYHSKTCHNKGCASGQCTDSTFKSEEKVKECGTAGCSNGECNIACYQNSDCGIDKYIGDNFCLNGDLYKKWRTYTCNNAGAISASCSYSDSNKKVQDCGTDEYIGSTTCQSNDAWQTWRMKICSNSGGAHCSYTDQFKKKIECGDSYCENWKEEYCKDGDVYKKRTCYNKGCALGNCFNEGYQDEQKAQDCEYGCSEEGVTHCKKEVCSWIGCYYI